jgi:hypothetical protein
MAPVESFLLWRFRTLWNWDRGYDALREHFAARTRLRLALRARYGWRWRSTAPAHEVLPWKLARYGVTIDPTLLPLPDDVRAGR